MASRKKGRGEGDDDNVVVLYPDEYVDRIAEILIEAPPGSLTALRLIFVKLELLHKVQELERIAVESDERSYRQLASILRATLRAHDRAHKDPVHLDQLEHAAANVVDALEDEHQDAQLPPEGFRPVRRGRKPHTVEAKQLADVLRRSLARDLNLSPSELAACLTGDFLRALNNQAPSLAAMCKSCDTPHAHSEICKAFERFPVQEDSIAICERLVVVGLNALGADSNKTRFLFDARRKKEDRG